MKTYRIFVEPEKGVFVYKNSIVKRPAHEMEHYAFSVDKQTYEFDDVKQNIVGIAIAPNKPIYRNSKELGEHQVIFHKEDIEVMAYGFGQGQFFNELTFEHDDRKKVQSASLYLSYVVDRSNGLTAPDKFSDAPDGTWILGYHFTDKQEYLYAKENFSGFSVEGDFYIEEIENNINMSKQEKSIFQKIGDVFKALSEDEPKKENFESATLQDGTVVMWDGELAEGTPLFVQPEEGDLVPAPDGDHVLEDGTIVTTMEGLVTVITVAEEQKEEKEKSEEYSADFKAEVKDALALLLQGFSSQRELVESWKKEIDENFEKLQAENKELESKFEEVAKLPSEEPEKKKFAGQKLNTRAEYLKQKWSKK